jgi:hypothetical protein
MGPEKVECPFFHPSIGLDYLFLAAAFRMIAAHFVASASDSNPKTAEYFLPTTWATRKSMLIPAPAMACAVA